MKYIDSTLRLSDYLAEHSHMGCIHKSSDGTGIGGWCHIMIVSDGTFDTVKRFLWLKDVRVPHTLAKFEIHHEKVVAIPKRVWSIVFPEMKDLIGKFEEESGEEVLVKKVDGMTEWYSGSLD